ncbi:MAG: hypothetical protein Q8L29_02760 [archaeon]|nr:hypothetical protein [archaeon]
MVKNIIKDSKAQLRIITGVSVIAFGTLAAFFLGLGIALNNQNLLWIGGVIMGGVPFAIAIISRWLI